uniref:Uncharacterized protein n=1 Tax=Rhizophora mucronata TaxID=61149 RepID=A0A2P2KX18_RHIMU
MLLGALPRFGVLLTVLLNHPPPLLD